MRIYITILTGMLLISIPDAQKAPYVYSQAYHRADLDGDGTEEIIYGSGAGCVHVLKREVGGFREIWSSNLLKSPVVSIQVIDIDHDYEPEIVVGTAKGCIFIFGTERFLLEWDNRLDDLGSLTGMLVRDIDSDGKLEIVAYNPDHIYVLEEGSYHREWVSEENIGGAERVVIGNVDRTPEPEMITNTGFVIDPEFYRIKWQHSRSFGSDIWLEDIDGDDMDELIADDGKGQLTVYDLDLKTSRIR